MLTCVLPNSCHYQCPGLGPSLGDVDEFFPFTLWVHGYLFFKGLDDSVMFSLWW
jgi:hypothetical protein